MTSRGKAGSIRIESNRPDRTVVTVQHGAALLSRQIPQLDSAMSVTRGQELSVGMEGHGESRAIFSEEESAIMVVPHALSPQVLRVRSDSAGERADVC